MKKFISNKYTLFALGTLFVIALWFILSACFDTNNGIFPSPIATFQEFGVLLTKPYSYQCLGYTFLRMLIGFAASFALALIIGIPAGNHSQVHTFLKPLMTTIKSIPTVALVFLFVVMVAPKNAPIFVVVIVCFPILYEAVAGGIRKVDQQVDYAAQIDGAGYFQRVLFIKLPLSIPYILVGIASSFSLSFKLEIMAEVITGFTKNGLGSVIHFVRQEDPTNLTGVFAYSLFAIIFMLLISLLETAIKQKFNKQTN